MCPRTGNFLESRGPVFLEDKSHISDLLNKVGCPNYTRYTQSHPGERHVGRKYARTYAWPQFDGYGKCLAFIGT